MMFKYYCISKKEQTLDELILQSDTSDVGPGLYLYKDYDYCVSNAFYNEEIYVYEIIPVMEKWNPSYADRVLDEEYYVQVVALHRELLEDVKEERPHVYNFWKEFVSEDDGVIVCQGKNNVLDTAVNDYLRGMITDYTYLKLASKFFKGYDLVLSDKAVSHKFRITNVKRLSIDAQKEIIERNRTNKKRELEVYNHLRAVLNTLRRGLYFSEVKDSTDSFYARSRYDERYYLSDKIDWSKV